MKPGWGQFFVTQRGQFRMAFDSRPPFVDNKHLASRRRERFRDHRTPYARADHEPIGPHVDGERAVRPPCPCCSGFLSAPEPSDLAAAELA
jgi:hypothetical protein